jgi:catechol 2,3-dioxygenase-like lactoylglutathione lyase family enzyme
MTRLTELLAASLVSLLMATLIAAAAPAAPADQPASAETTRPFFWQNSMNVFRRFAVDRAKMIEFYGDVLGLKPLQTFELGGGSQMTRFGVGTSEVKLTTRVGTKQYQPGGVNTAIGLRLFTFHVENESALVERLARHGYPAPQFRVRKSDGARVAVLPDPDGQSVQIVVSPGAPRSTLDTIEVGITVSDLEKSRAFYRSFVGLEELPPVVDDSIGTTAYPFRHGTTIVKLWSFGKDLPVDTGSAGIQYVVWNVNGVDALARARHIAIDQPLRGDANASLRTIWLMDPDGVTNYFAETARARQDGKLIVESR